MDLKIWTCWEGCRLAGSLLSISEASRQLKALDTTCRSYHSLPARRLRLVGGIRSSRGNNFFSFAPPDVALEGESRRVRACIVTVCL